MISKEDFEDFMLWSYPTDIIEKESEDFEQKLVSELECLLNETKSITKEALKEYVVNLPIERRKSTTQLFRVLTGISRINFEISFLQLVNLEDNEYHFEVTPQKNSKNFSYFLINGKERTAIDEQGIAKIIQDKPIAILLIDYFSKKNLFEILNLFKNDLDYGKKFLKILTKFDSKGKQAQNRGKKAENMVKEKLVEYGLEIDVDFNTSDLDVFDQVSKKLQVECDCGKISQDQVNKKIEEMKKHIKANSNFKRKSDIVLYLDNPSLLIQSTFYTSDVASIADATADELNDERELIEKGTSGTGIEIKLIGLIDGPGLAITISFTRVLRVLNAPNDFFQIRTVPTKLRDLIHKSNNSLPIDIEVGIYSKKGDFEIEENDLIKQLEQIYNSKIMWKNEIDRWASRNKISKDGSKIKTNPIRKDIIKKYLILDLLIIQSQSGMNKNIILPGNKSVDKEIFRGFIEKTYPFLKDNVDNTLDYFVENKEIIIK